MEKNTNITDEELAELGNRQVLQNKLNSERSKVKESEEVDTSIHNTESGSGNVNITQTSISLDEIAEKEKSVANQDFSSMKPLNSEEDDFVPTSLPADEFQAKYEAEMERQRGLSGEDRTIPSDSVETLDGTSGTVVESKPVEDNYEGSGLVVKNSDIKADNVPGHSDELPEEIKNSIDSYMENMDQDFKDSAEIRNSLGYLVDPTSLSKDEIENRGAHSEAPSGKGVVDSRKQSSADGNEIEIDDSVVYDEDGKERSARSVKAEERMVIIDKLAETSITFSEDERKKLERAKVIRLREIETSEVKTVKRRRIKLKDQKSALGKILKRRTNTLTEYNVALPASGYSAVMQGCSPHEIMTLENDEDGDRRTNALNKWSLIYDKIKSTSLGKMTFDEFMNRTATMDMDVLLYGILGATFPEKDKITLRCANEECVDSKGEANEYDFPYDVRSLLRIEQLSDDALKIVDRLVTEGYTEEGAKRIHEDALVGSVKEVMLPETGYIVYLTATSASDFIDRVLKFVDEGIEENKAQAAIVASAIPEILVPEDPYDPETEYFPFTDIDAVTDIVYSLPMKDTQVLAKVGDKFTENSSFTFGLLDTECPYCGRKDDFVEIDISQILFYRNGLAMNTIVE